MATFKIILDKRSTKHDPKHYLTVRVSHKKDIIYLRLGPKMSVKEYESIFKKVSYDSKIEDIRKGYEKYIERAKKIFQLIDPLDISKFRKLYFDKNYNPSTTNMEEGNEFSIKQMYENYLKVETENGRLSLGTTTIYNYNKRALLKFKQDLIYSDITPEFLNSFENWFLNNTNKKGKKNSQATVGNILRSLRCILNYYIKKKIIPTTYEYPFLEFKIPDFKPPKFVISNVEIQSIIDCKEFDDKLEEYARDIWVLLYRMNGINFIDLLKLRWDQKKGSHFILTRHKTRKTRRNNIRQIQIKISSKIQSSLDKVGDKDSKFVLGQIHQENYDETYLINRNKKLKTRINFYLKKVGKRLNLTMPLDISMARDAYANTLKRADVNPLKITEQMNHSDPRTTQMYYLDMFDQETLDDSNESIM